MIMKLSLGDLRGVTGELKVFYGSFSDFFRNRTRSVLKQAFQYRFGKVENCQVGVFLGYALWSRRTLIDKRLYLPEDWANDPVRRERCGVPDNITFKTKAELGLEMLLAARERGVPFAWIGMDCFYGQQSRADVCSIWLRYIQDK